MLPDSPAGRAASWYLHLLARGPETLTAEEVKRRFAPSLLSEGEHREDPDWWREWWRSWFSDAVGPFEVESFEAQSDHGLMVRLAAHRGRWWRLRLCVEDVPPHRITVRDLDPAPPPGVVVRDARPEDQAGLIELERVTPMRLGDTLVTFDHREDFFGWTRLIEPVRVAIAEVDGVVGGINVGYVRRCVVGGEEHVLSSSCHLRIHPEFQRRGVWSSINPLLWEFYSEHTDEGSFVLISERNAIMQRRFAEDSGHWDIAPERVLMRTSEVSGPRAGRPATPADAERIVHILNDTHSPEEMYWPYTVQSLSSRLERARDLYSWEHVRMAGDAVVGVWPARLYVTREREVVRSEDVRGFVLDYGFCEGAEDDFEALLRSWCGELAEMGLSELTIFTSKASRGYDLLASLGSELERFDLWIFAIEQPDGAAERGVYVDQAYF